MSRINDRQRSYDVSLFALARGIDAREVAALRENAERVAGRYARLSGTTEPARETEPRLLPCPWCGHPSAG